jgi:hypothetical protein
MLLLSISDLADMYQCLPIWTSPIKLMNLVLYIRQWNNFHSDFICHGYWEILPNYVSVYTYCDFLSYLHILKKNFLERVSIYRCWWLGKRTESHRTKSHRTKSHKTPRTESHRTKSHNLYVLPWRTKKYLNEHKT